MVPKIFQLCEIWLQFDTISECKSDYHSKETSGNKLQGIKRHEIDRSKVVNRNEFLYSTLVKMIYGGYHP
jgi:hypothetical protein